jgi:hypothetical protein
MVLGRARQVRGGSRAGGRSHRRRSRECSAYWLVHAYSGAALADVRRGALDEAVVRAGRALEFCDGRGYFASCGQYRPRSSVGPTRLPAVPAKRSRCSSARPQSAAYGPRPSSSFWGRPICPAIA